MYVALGSNDVECYWKRKSSEYIIYLYNVYIYTTYHHGALVVTCRVGVAGVLGWWVCWGGGCVGVVGVLGWRVQNLAVCKHI